MGQAVVTAGRQRQLQLTNQGLAVVFRQPVADLVNHRVRKVTSDGVISTVAGIDWIQWRRRAGN
jgi:hypothetical protein